MTPSPTLAAALEAALELYLKQDPEALTHCAAMAGKVIELDITGVGLTLYFIPGADGIQVFSRYEGEADTKLVGSPLGFARLALGNRENALFQGDVEIRGDSETGQQFQDILSRLEWDWEEQVSRVTGDVLAHQIGNFSRQVGSLARETRDTLGQDLSEYLQEESRLLPTRIEVVHFLDEVDQLRSDVDRLTARIERLSTHPEDDS